MFTLPTTLDELELRSGQESKKVLLNALDNHPRPGITRLYHHYIPFRRVPQGDDIPGVVRYRTYEVLKKEADNPRLRWAYLPYSMHMAGPREAIQHMIIRKNYGCTHFIIGRDMAGCKSSISGDDFYGAYDAQVNSGDATSRLTAALRDDYGVGAASGICNATC